jgi:thiol-disulfide isomerase/thioredoxin
MTRTSLALIFILGCSTLATAEVIRAVDETGAAVDKFEAMYFTADRGYSRWESGRNGACDLPLRMGRNPTVVDVLVRADGYATAVRRFTAEEVKALRPDSATVTLVKGQQIKVQLANSEKNKLPDGFALETYFPQFADRVRMMWQPENQRRERRTFNLLNLQSEENGTFVLHLPTDLVPFYIAVDQPGWLRFCELGPFTKDDIARGALTLELPRPAPIEARLDMGDLSADELPFKEASCQVMWKNPDGPSGSWYSANGANGTTHQGVYHIDDLAPGHYLVQLRTTPKDGVLNIEGSQINPGKFFDQREVQTVSGEKSLIEFKYVPFDPNACHGSASAELTLLQADGKPAAGKQAKVDWFDGHYGSITVLKKTVPNDGVIKLDDVSSESAPESTLGSYTVSVDDQRIGFFGLKDSHDIQKFKFRMTPQVGDMAPDFSFASVKTGEPHRLAEFKGKIVLVEFWATWCGPCQPAMSKLVEMHAAHEANWKDQVAVVALSTDEKREHAARHVEARNWDSLPQYWADRPSDGRFSDAELAYVVHGIPHAVLIDAAGKIAWRGHPLADEDGLNLPERIEALLNH